MSQDFEAFARGFRERTSARLLEFEKALAQAQEQLEKSASAAARQAPEPAQAPHSPAVRRGRPGQVKSVLRRD
ncbi:hypothetical protein [Corynebacterium flavescens]|uniref:hypothetical protein n=1 Tax=Corynebacterium flavescens TaxID=28028 RepID=UPI003FD56E67